MPVLSISSFHVRESLYTQSEISFSDNNWIRNILCSKTSTWFKIIVLNLYASFFVLENDSLQRDKRIYLRLCFVKKLGGGGGGGGGYAWMNQINISCVFATLIFKLYP